MKATQHKTKAAEPAAKSAPFFKKEAEQGFFQPIQPKLTVGGADDPMEKEADHVADQVVQKMDKESVARKPIFDSKNDKADDSVQRKVSGPSGSSTSGGGPGSSGSSSSGSGGAALGKSAGSVPAQVEHSIAASKGGGSALPDGTRKEMEQTIGSDLSSVRVHNDSAAGKMSKDLGAQAFTHGKDVYFGSGNYSPETKGGKHLLAHELTHTVQQDAVRRAPDVQRGTTGGSGGTGGTGGAGGGTGGGDAVDPKTIFLPVFKKEHAKEGGITIEGEVEYKPDYDRKTAEKETAKPGEGSTAQADIWDKAVKKDVEEKVKAMVEKAAATSSQKDQNTPNAEATYYLKDSRVAPGGLGFTVLIGTEKSIVENSLRPQWNKQGLASTYDVDHVKELQLQGTNEITNMELLNSSANSSSGSLIKAQMKRKANLQKAAGEPEPYKFKIDYGDGANQSNFGKQKQAADYWTKKDIVGGLHLKHFVGITDTNLLKKVKGETEAIIYTSEVGGRGLIEKELKSMQNVGILAATYTPKPGNDEGKATKGSLDLNLQIPQAGTYDMKGIPVYQIAGVINGGNIPRRREGKGGLQRILSKLQIAGLSPADIESAELDGKKGIVIKGVIHPTLDIVKGIDLDFYVQGKDFGISKTITAGDIKTPSPFKITDAFLTIGGGTNGIFVEGTAMFEIKNLGKGSITGKGSSDGSFGIEGKFNFDKKLFKGDASVHVGYDNKQGWSIGGTLQLSDKIKGIKEGSVTVEYANGVLTAIGTAKTTIKGIKDVKLQITMGPEESKFEGDVTLDKVPGIESGEGHLQIVKADDKYSFSGSGKLIPAIPKVSSQIDFSFHDDVFTVDATLDYVNDRLSGSLHVGITNQDVEDDDKSGGKAKPKGKNKGEFRVYGGGELKLKVTENVIATAGVNLLPNGEIEVKGGITLPGKFEVVPTLLDIKDQDIIPFPEISIPLFGIPLGVKTIGLNAFIRPKLTASVQLGPGSLTNVGAEITYNPAHPDDMTVTGQADFEFIASAGIKAGIEMGIGLDAGIADVEGGINLSAYINAAAEQPVFHTDIKYSPKTGFELNGDVKAIVKAILGFSGTLFLEASVGVWRLKKTWRWEKELFKKDIDTGVEIGFEFPFGYKDGKANASFDNLKFKYPKFDAGLIDKVKKAIVDPAKEELFGS